MRKMSDRVKFDNKDIEIQAWMNANSDYLTTYPQLAALSQMLEIGRASDEGASAMYDAIRACFAGIEGAPFRKGKVSNLPAQVVANAEKASNDYGLAISQLWSESDDIASMMVRHGRSGGGIYSDASEVHDAYSKPVKNRLTKAYTDMTNENVGADYWWDGELPVNLIQPAGDDSEDSEE